MAAKEHKLKCWDVYYDAIDQGDKTFDVRRDDRGFQKGDILILQRWERDRNNYTRHISDNTPYETRRKVKYILTGGQFGIEPGFVVLGLSR
jgi:hypothetical protein